MSRSYYLRTEPRSTSASLVPGLTVRIYDPTWMLGRQWQVGELLGDDAGTPVALELDAEMAMLSSYQPVGGAAVAYEPGRRPLDTVAESDVERGGASWTVQLRIDTGRALVRELIAAGLDAYVDAFRGGYRLAAPTFDERRRDPRGCRLLDVASGRIPDGQLLYDALVTDLRAGRPLDLPDAVPAGQGGLVTTAVQAWLDWCDTTITEPIGVSSWDDEDLSYGFGVATAGDDVVLDATHHRGGGLEWYSFTVRPGGGSASFTALPPVVSVPTGVRFRGMPKARWWEMEDASVDLGAVDAGPSDVARMALLEFALIYGNDFFAVPLRLPVGSLTRITDLVVLDSFGLRLRIGPGAYGAGRPGDPRWSMFTLTEQAPGRPASGVGDLFFVPPTAHHVATSKPLEEVLLLRDEMADLAWAVELAYEGGAGTPLLRAEQEPRPEAAQPPPAGAPLHYFLGTSVPSYWFPLLPQRVGGDLRLRLDRMANQDASVSPRGRFLEVDGRTFADGEVPREGRRLLRERTLARWSDGSTSLWSRRLGRVGRGEGSSGLRFDVTLSSDDSGA